LTGQIGALLNSTVEAVELPIGKVTEAIANETSKNNAFIESNQSGYAEMVRLPTSCIKGLRHPFEFSR
jgi:hypothetical protein